MEQVANYGLFVLASFISAELWTLAGYFTEWRKFRNDPTWTGFDKKALLHDSILGAALGIGVVVYTAIVEGTPVAIPIPDITSFHIFVVLVGTLFGAVALVDKYFVNGFLGIDSRTPITGDFAQDNTVIPAGKPQI